MPERDSTALDVIFQHGAELCRQGRLTEAEHIRQQLRQRQPAHLGAQRLPGAITSQTGRAERAVELFGQAIAIDPGAAAAYNNRGNAPRDLRHYAPLASVPGLCLISLQKGDAAAQAKAPPDGMVPHDRTEELDDFADTAALVEALDLVISVDAAVVHLAGALGKPAWC